MVHSIIKNYLKVNFKDFVFIAFFGILSSMISFFLTIVIGAFFALQFHEHGSKSRLLDMMGVNLTSLDSFFGLFLFLVLLKGIFTLAYNWKMEIYAEKFSQSLRSKMFSAQIAQPPEIFLRKNHGYYLLRYSGDLNAVRNYLTKGILGCVKHGLFLLLGISLLACIHVKLTLYWIALFCTALVISSSIISFQKKSIKRSRELRSNLLAYVSRKFGSYSKINQLSLEAETIDRFNKKSNELYKSNQINVIFESSIGAIIPVLQYLTLALLLYLSIDVSPPISYSDDLIFVLIVLLLFSDMRQMLKLTSILNKGSISLMKIEEIFRQSNLHDCQYTTSEVDMAV